MSFNLKTPVGHGHVAIAIRGGGTHSNVVYVSQVDIVEPTPLSGQTQSDVLQPEDSSWPLTSDAMS